MLVAVRAGTPRGDGRGREDSPQPIARPLGGRFGFPEPGDGRENLPGSDFLDGGSAEGGIPKTGRLHKDKREEAFLGRWLCSPIIPS